MYLFNQKSSKMPLGKKEKQWNAKGLQEGLDAQAQQEGLDSRQLHLQKQCNIFSVLNRIFI